MQRGAIYTKLYILKSYILPKQSQDAHRQSSERARTGSFVLLRAGSVLVGLFLLVFAVNEDKQGPGLPSG